MDLGAIVKMYDFPHRKDCYHIGVVIGETDLQITRCKTYKKVVNGSSVEIDDDHGFGFDERFLYSAEFDTTIVEIIG
jgi:inosine/xanthosine triphosphate pyrophosphatase family protein